MPPTHVTASHATATTATTTLAAAAVTASALTTPSVATATIPTAPFAAAALAAAAFAAAAIATAVHTATFATAAVGARGRICDGRRVSPRLSAVAPTVPIAADAAACELRQSVRHVECHVRRSAHVPLVRNNPQD